MRETKKIAELESNLKQKSVELQGEVQEEDYKIFSRLFLR